MRKITDLNEVRSLLTKYEFEMFNRANDHEGEITILNEKDINDIIGDMHMGTISAVVEVDENDMVIVKYPYNVCKLESRGLIIN